MGFVFLAPKHAVVVSVITKPKFRVGQVVTYKGNRRLRRTITKRYRDCNGTWRYKFIEPGLRADLRECWAVIESELEPVKR
jgi:hypothetical protein